MLSTATTWTGKLAARSPTNIGKPLHRNWSVDAASPSKSARRCVAGDVRARLHLPKASEQARRGWMVKRPMRRPPARPCWNLVSTPRLDVRSVRREHHPGAMISVGIKSGMHRRGPMHAAWALALTLLVATSELAISQALPGPWGVARRVALLRVRPAEGPTHARRVNLKPRPCPLTRRAANAPCCCAHLKAAP